MTPRPDVRPEITPTHADQPPIGHAICCQAQQGQTYVTRCGLVRTKRSATGSKFRENPTPCVVCADLTVTQAAICPSGGLCEPRQRLYR